MEKENCVVGLRISVDTQKNPFHYLHYIPIIIIIIITINLQNQKQDCLTPNMEKSEIELQFDNRKYRNVESTFCQKKVPVIV